MFNRLTGSREKAFAQELVAGLQKEIPPSLMAERRTALSVNRVSKLLERTYRSAAAYQQQHGIGFVRRAILANSFKWEMRSKAYPEDFIEVATEGLVVELSKAARRKATDS